MNTSREISRSELRAMIDAKESFVLAEALDLPYYEAAHLPGAIAMPLAKVREVAHARIGDKNATVVVYCASITCRNSHIAADRLTALGYPNVRVYAEGKADWKSAGLPLEEGSR